MILSKISGLNSNNSPTTKNVASVSCFLNRSNILSMPLMTEGSCFSLLIFCFINSFIFSIEFCVFCIVLVFRFKFSLEKIFIMSSIKISPSILSADFSKLGNEIRDLEKAKADLIHIDVMDGHFVPNITIGPEVIKKLRKYTSLPFDVHLMISPVHDFIKNFADAGADIITIHPEATTDLISSIKKIKSYNKKVGISLNPETSVNKVLPVLNLIDLVLVMSVNPGFGGQQFMKDTLEKVKVIRKEIDSKNLKTQIEIDGGININYLNFPRFEYRLKPSLTLFHNCCIKSVSP